MVVCPSCGVSTSFCPRCGFPLVRTSVTCNSCKQVINYCFNCNAPLRKITKEIEAPAKIEEARAPVLEKPIKVPLKVCSFHPEIEATAKCDACDKLLCKDCAKKFGDLILCPEDYPKDIELAEYAAPPIIKKYPKTALTLLIFSMFLIFFQIFFILYQPPLFFKGTLIVNTIYMIYVLLIINISMVASILLILKLKYPTLGSFIAMFASLISLFIGGGFFVGSILGIAGGLISMVES